MRDAVARAARDDIVRFNVEALCNLYAMPVVCRLLDVEVAPRGRQDGRNLLVVGFDGAALSAKRVDEYFDSLASLRGPVGARE